MSRRARRCASTSASRWVASRVESTKPPSGLRVTAAVVALGDMEPGEERAFTAEVANTGDMTAHIRDSHTPGPLEVWVRRVTVKPGERVTVFGRVRVNTRQIDRQLRARVALCDELMF